MTTNSLLKLAKTCLKGDIAGSINQARYRLEKLEPVERESFLLMFVSLLRYQIDAVVDESVSSIIHDLGMFKTKKTTPPKRTTADRVSLWSS
jgi:hypothetical protein